LFTLTIGSVTCGCHIRASGIISACNSEASRVSLAGITFTAWSSSIARDTFLVDGVTKSTSAIGISIRARLLLALEVFGVTGFIREACGPNIIRVTVGGNTFSSAFNAVVV